MPLPIKGASVSRFLFDFSDTICMFRRPNKRANNTAINGPGIAAHGDVVAGECQCSRKLSWCAFRLHVHDQIETFIEPGEVLLFVVDDVVEAQVPHGLQFRLAAIHAPHRAAALFGELKREGAHATTAPIEKHPFAFLHPADLHHGLVGQLQCVRCGGGLYEGKTVRNVAQFRLTHGHELREGAQAAIGGIAVDLVAYAQLAYTGTERLHHARQLHARNGPPRAEEA